MIDIILQSIFIKYFAGKSLIKFIDQVLLKVLVIKVWKIKK